MANEQKSKIIFYVNFLITFILFLIIFQYNTSLVTANHDYAHPYRLNAYMDRFLPVITSYFLHVILPSIFDINVVDFKTNIFSCSFFSMLYLYIIFLITKTFYLFSGNNNTILKRKETIFVLPFVFVFALYFNRSDIFLGISETTIFLEHSFSYIIYFPFIFMIYDLFFNNKNFSKKETVFYGFISLLLGCWIEFINVPVFWSIIIFCFVIVIYKRELIKNKTFICAISCFFVGFLLYNFRCLFPFASGTSPIGQYNIWEKLPENLANISNFNREFVQVLFKDPVFFWIIIFSSQILFWLINWKNGLKENICYTFLGLSPILGFLCTCYMTIFIQNFREGLPTCYFSMIYFYTMYFIILVFTFLYFIGLLYFKISNKLLQKAILITAIIIPMISYINMYGIIDIYINNIKNNHQEKLLKYELEKVIVLYSLFGESAIVKNDKVLHSIVLHDLTNRTFIGNNFEARFQPYYESSYNREFHGLRIRPEEIVRKEYNRRLEIIGDIDNEYNMFGQILFTPLKKIDNFNLDFEKIKELREKYGEKDFLLKAEAYRYYEKDDYEMAILLYEKYLNIYDNNDIDALINLYKIYKRRNDDIKVDDLGKKIINILGNEVKLEEII